MKKILIIIISLFNSLFLFGLELTTTDVSVIRVGIIDMNRVLSESKTAILQRDNYLKLKEVKENEIKSAEQELSELLKKEIQLQTEIDQLKIQLKLLEENSKTNQNKDFSGNLNISTFSSSETQSFKEEINRITDEISNKEKNYSQIKNEITNKRETINQKKIAVENELLENKEKLEAELFGIFYEIIEKVSKEENLNIVVEKNSILYGISDLDITDKVIKYIGK